MSENQINKPLLIATGIVFLLVSAWAVYRFYYFPKNIENPEPTACTMDAKICPDGSAVGRIPPSCEFADCPTTTATDSAEINLVE